MVLTSDLKMNKLLLNKETQTRFIIFRVIKSSGYIYLIAFKKGSKDAKLPARYSLAAIKRKIESSELVLLDSNPLVKLIPEHKWSDSQRTVITRAWKKIEGLVNSDILIDTSNRFKAMEEVCEEEPKVTMPTLLSWIKNYFVGGMVLSAIAPNFSRCGGPGKDRNTKKVPDVIIDLIKNGAQKYWLNSNMTIGEARLETKRKLYHREIHGDVFPDYDTFRRYLRKHFPNAFENKLRRLGRKNAQRTSRLKQGRATDIAWEVGDLFQIDWTTMEINLVASFNRNLCIGIPKLYVVIDSHSRLIAGILITMENPCWNTFMQAIFNAARNKVKFSALYDLTIQAGEWLGECVPQSIIADGEAAILKANDLGEILGITLANAESYRGDLKGIVERVHQTIKSRYKIYLDGAGATVERYGRRLGVDARKEACITLEELYRIAIKVVIEYNSATMKNYPNETSLLENLTDKTPNAIWQAAVDDGYGIQRPYDEDTLRLDLLKKHTRIPDDYGFEINKHFFVPRDDEDHSLLQNLINQPNGAGRHIVSYDPNYFPDKYWLYEDRFIPLRKLGEEEQEYRSEMEMKAANKYYDDQALKKREEEEERRLTTVNYIVETATDAKQAQGNTKVLVKDTQAAVDMEKALEKNRDFGKPPSISSPQQSQTLDEKYGDDYIFSMYEEDLKQIDKELHHV